MATSIANLVTRLSPVSFAPKGNISSVKEAEFVHQSVLSSKGDRCLQSEQLSTSCTPVILEFRRLFQSAKFKTVDVIPGVPNRELLHAVIALYDVSLPDITPEVLYFTVCGKWAKTLLLLRDVKDVAADLKPKASVKGADSSNVSSGTGVSLSAADTDTDSSHLTSDLSLIDLEAEDQDPSSQHDSANTDTDTDLSTTKDKQERSDGMFMTSEQQPGDETTKATTTETEGHKKGVFADVFSDTESEKESDSDDDDEDYTEGQDAFLRLVKERRKRRQLALSQGQDPSSDLGIESRLIACATWEKSTIRPGEKNVQIDLLAVRRRFRKLGIGKYLLQVFRCSFLDDDSISESLKDISVVGLYDALVVYADHTAVDFFSHYGFDDDIILNSKFSDLADNWTNCTLMCYLPPFTGQTILMESDAGLDLKLMELELQKWSIKSREAYQAQMACTMKLKHEITSLRALVSSQQELIQSLTHELEKLGADKFHMEKEYLQQRLSDLRLDVGLSARNLATNGTGDDSTDEEETDKLIRDLERRITSFGTSDVESSSSDGGINWQIAEEFKLSMDDSVMAGMCAVSKTVKATVSSSATEMFNIRCSHLRDPSIRTKMYLCGTLQHPERIPKILSDGFSEQDFSHGEYGVGLHFSQHASKAAHFSALGKLLLVDVGLGKTDSVIKADNTRTLPPEGFDTIVTPGRLSLLSGGDGMMSGCQEYIIFDPCQALPVYLIEYRLE